MPANVDPAADAARRQQEARGRATDNRMIARELAIKAKAKETGEEPEIPDNFDLEDEEASEALVAAMSGTGPKVVDRTPPAPLPTSLQEMWQHVLVLQEKVKALEYHVATAGIGPRQSDDIYHTKHFECDECKTVTPFTLPFPPGQVMMCPKCNQATMLRPVADPVPVEA